MESYNLWRDVLDTYQSSPDWIKALWLVSIPGFLLGVLALVLRYRVAVRRLERFADGRPVWSVVAGTDGTYRVHRHHRGPAQNRDTAQKSTRGVGTALVFPPLPPGSGEVDRPPADHPDK